MNKSCVSRQLLCSFTIFATAIAAIFCCHSILSSSVFLFSIIIIFLSCFRKIIIELKAKVRKQKLNSRVSIPGTHMQRLHADIQNVKWNTFFFLLVLIFRLTSIRPLHANRSSRTFFILACIGNRRVSKDAMSTQVEQKKKKNKRAITSYALRFECTARGRQN